MANPTIKEMKDKPNWWPENPYPESIFPMPREKYPEIVPDPKTRTALSGMLGRCFWDIASKSILDAMKEGLVQRVVETLDWMVKDAKWRADEYINNVEVGSRGGYQPKLTEAIELLKELKE